MSERAKSMKRIRHFLPVACIVMQVMFPAFAGDDGGTNCSGRTVFLMDALKGQIADPLLEAYDVKYYLIDLEVNDTSTFIRGSASVTLETGSEGLDTLALEMLDALQVDSMFVNGTAVFGWIKGGNLLKIPLDPEAAPGTLLTVKTIYHGSPPGQGFFSGLANVTDSKWNQQVTYTLSESFHSLEWFSCKQVLSDKADSSCVIITTPPGLMAGSNGLLKDKTVLDDGRVRFTWVNGHPIAYYLISLTVGNYMDYSIYAHPPGQDSILIQNYIYNDPSFLPANREDIDKTAGMIELLSQLYGPYPWADEKYGHCFAPIGGGMEHQTMTTLSAFNFDLVSHELGHQWFGDYVTCKSWQDIWVNEGFASYTEYLCREFLKTKEEADLWMTDAHNRALGGTQGSVYVPAEDVDNEFRIFNNSLSYKKGASIIHMLRFEIGNDSLFFLSLRNYLDQFGDSVAGGTDFRDVVEETTGMDLDWFFDQWYFGAGYPEFNFDWWQEGDSLTIFCKESTTNTLMPFFRSKLEFRVQFENGEDTVLTTEQTSAEQTLLFILEQPVAQIEFDPHNWVLGKSKINLKLSTEYMKFNPNPFTDEIRLEFRTGNTERRVMISDLQGRIFRQFTTHEKLVTIPAGKLNPGVYMISVKDGKEDYSAKLVKR